MTVCRLWGCRVVIQVVVINRGVWGPVANITSHVGITTSIGIIIAPGVHKVLQKR